MTRSRWGLWGWSIKNWQDTCLIGVVLVFLGLLLYGLVGCGGSGWSPFKTGVGGTGGSAADPVVTSPSAVLDSIVIGLIWAIRILTFGIIGIWGLAAWLPYVSMKSAIGATMGLLALIVVAWLTSWLAAYGVWVLWIGGGLSLAAVVYLYWPMMKTWRTRVVVKEAIKRIELNDSAGGQALLDEHGIKSTNGGKHVRIGRKKVTIGAKA